MFMKVWRLGGCENFVGKWEEFVFDVIRDFQPVEKTYDRVIWQDASFNHSRQHEQEKLENSECAADRIET